MDALVVSGVGGEQIFTLKGAEHPYRVLIEDMNEGALTLTAEGVILYANRRFAEMLKTPLEKVIGSTIHTWIAPDSQGILQALLQKGADEKRREELVLTASDGTQVPVYLSVNRLSVEGMPDSFGLVATDLTEQKKRNEAIVAAEKSAREMLEERQRLAHDLHDAVNQTLFSASLIAEVLPRMWEKDQAEARRSLDDLRRLTRGALAEMRGLLAELQPSTLTDLDLGDLLRQLGNALSGRTDIPVTVTITGKFNLPSEIQMTFYRVCQEALHNVARHAKASRVEINLQQDGDVIELRIRDNGQGFDPEQTFSGHYGLGMMRERAEAAGALLTVTSQPGHGTELTIRWTMTRTQGGLMTTQQPIRVMIVDDHTMVRRGLATILKVFDDLLLVGEAENGAEAIKLCGEVLPDVILMDMVMPDMDGATTTRVIRQQFPQVQIIALTSFKEGNLVKNALEAGAIAYLLKDVYADDLARAIRAAHAGRATLSPEAAQSLVETANQPPVPGLDLTEREREVLALMVEGLNNTQIAGRLTVSPSTIKSHVSNILSKLGVTSRTEAVTLALRSRIVP